MSLLAHLVPRIAGGGVEPAATRALVYLLRSDKAAGAFVELLAPAHMPSFRPSSVKAEERHEAGQPDLTVRDREDRIRILVENKFWAGLTKQQPVAYLEELPQEVSAALLFVVPRQRIPALWGELVRRCQNGLIALENESRSTTLRWARVGRHTLAITSWKQVLETLERADEDATYRADVAQLRSLTDRMNIDAFRPSSPRRSPTNPCPAAWSTTAT